MPCTLISPRHFEAVRIRGRLIVIVDPPLEAGHSLALEDISPSPDDIRLRVLDCDVATGSPESAVIESDKFFDFRAVALRHASGIVRVDVREPVAANGGPPAPPSPERGGGPTLDAERGAGAGPSPPPGRNGRPSSPEPAPSPGAGGTAPPSTIGYGLLDAPEVAVVGAPFVVKVGLSETRTEGKADKELPRPPGVGETFKLQVQLQADIDALAVLQGSSWTVELDVSPDDPYPTEDVRFAAVVGAPRRGAALMAFFSINGQSIGWMSRAIGIVAAEGDSAPVAVSHNASDLAPPGEHPPDLTIQITDDPNVAPGLLMWVVTVPPSLGIASPDPESLRSDIGTDPATFARRMIDSIPAATPRQVYEKMLGLGRAIADEIPPGVIETYLRIESALAAEGRVPTVMIQTREPYVPWELAVVEWPPEKGRSPILGARAAVGRWILPERGKGPAYPPPLEVRVRSMAVVSGDYRRAGWASLPEARKEARALESEFKAKPIDAAEGPVSDLLAGKPRAQALHFAIHGKFSPESLEQGMILVDGHIAPDTVMGTPGLGTPFVFLNACQLGAADKLLGDYAGLAESFLLSGASAVVAPLWNVRDTIAREISLEFYRTVYGSAQRGERITAGEALRRTRARFTGRSQNATYLAYQLYGDPNLQLTH
jgi:hypothetical protein